MCILYMRYKTKLCASAERKEGGRIRLHKTALIINDQHPVGWPALLIINAELGMQRANVVMKTWNTR